MTEIRTLSEEDGVRIVTDGTDTWKEYDWPKRGPVEWFEQEVLFHPDKWYTKTLSFLFDLLVLLPLIIPVYQAAFIYFVSQWVGLAGWTWWQIVIKLVALVILWIPAMFLGIWAAQNAVGANGIDVDD